MIIQHRSGVQEGSATWIEVTAAVARYTVGFSVTMAGSQRLARSNSPYARCMIYGGDYGMRDLPGVIEQLQAILDEMRKRQAT